MKRTRTRWLSLLLVFMLFVSSIVPVYANTDTGTEQTEATEVVVAETEEATDNSALNVEYYDMFSAESIPVVMSADDGVAPVADYPDGYAISAAAIYAYGTSLDLTYNGTTMNVDHISLHKVWKNGGWNWAFCIEPTTPMLDISGGQERVCSCVL